MKPLSIICCSVLRREIESFLGQDYPEAEPVFLNSMLHMHPQRLRQAIDEALAARPGQDCLLIYGDCHAHMKESGQRPHCGRTTGVNCGDLLLGRELYRSYRAGKAFLFLPEWTERWREVFQQELGFVDQTLAHQFMQESQRRLVYCDTGLIPVPVQTLHAIAEFFGMPMEIVAVTLDQLRRSVRLAVEALKAGGGHES